MNNIADFNDNFVDILIKEYLEELKLSGNIKLLREAAYTSRQNLFEISLKSFLNFPKKHPKAFNYFLITLILTSGIKLIDFTDGNNINRNTGGTEYTEIINIAQKAPTTLQQINKGVKDKTLKTQQQQRKLALDSNEEYHKFEDNVFLRGVLEAKFFKTAGTSFTPFKIKFKYVNEDDPRYQKKITYYKKKVKSKKISKGKYGELLTIMQSQMLKNIYVDEFNQSESSFQEAVKLLDKYQPKWKRSREVTLSFANAFCGSYAGFLLKAGAKSGIPQSSAKYIGSSGYYYGAMAHKPGSAKFIYNGTIKKDKNGRYRSHRIKNLSYSADQIGQFLVPGTILQVGGDHSKPGHFLTITGMVIESDGSIKYVVSEGNTAASSIWNNIGNVYNAYKQMNAGLEGGQLEGEWIEDRNKPKPESIPQDLKSLRKYRAKIEKEKGFWGSFSQKITNIKRAATGAGKGSGTTAEVLYTPNQLVKKGIKSITIPAYAKKMYLNVKKLFDKGILKTKIADGFMETLEQQLESLVNKNEAFNRKNNNYLLEKYIKSYIKC